MIIITGPGRSGTSVLAKFCLQMGYDPGGSWHDCVDAGLEHPRVAVINDALYREVTHTGTVQQALAQYQEEMRTFDLAVVKDPRFTYHPAILRAWYSVRNDLSVLMTYRTPEHCIASRKRHARDLIHKNKAHPDVLRCDFANVIEAMLDIGLPFSMLLFPNFLTQYDSVYRAMETLGMKFDYEAGQAVWATLVNMEKVHILPTGMQSGGVAETKPRSDSQWKRVARLPEFSSGIYSKVLRVVKQICAPVGRKIKQ